MFIYIVCVYVYKTNNKNCARPFTFLNIPTFLVAAALILLLK